MKWAHIHRLYTKVLLHCQLHLLIHLAKIGKNDKTWVWRHNEMYKEAEVEIFVVMSIHYKKRNKIIKINISCDRLLMNTEVCIVWCSLRQLNFHAFLYFEFLKWMEHIEISPELSFKKAKILAHCHQYWFIQCNIELLILSITRPFCT